MRAATADTIAIRGAIKVEFTVVLYLGCTRVNHAGSRWFQQVTIGRGFHTYTKPQSAPNVILLNTLNVKIVIGGETMCSGRNSAALPRKSRNIGMRTSAPSTIKVAALPKFVIHLPT